MATGANDVCFGAVWKGMAVDAVNNFGGSVESVVRGSAVEVGGEVDVCTKAPKFTSNGDESIRLIPDFIL